MITGKGVFLWQQWAVTTDDDLLVARLVALGVKRLEIKSADGTMRFMKPGPKPQATKKLVDKCHAAGLECWTWQYAYGASPYLEGQVAGQIVEEAGADGHIVDAEAEFLRRTDSPARATQYNNAYRSETAKPLVLCTFALWRDPRTATVWFNPNTYISFMATCEAIMPMAYHYHNHGVLEYRRPDTILRESIIQLRALTDKAIVPAGKAYEDRNARLMAHDMTVFSDVAFDANCDATTWWSLQHIPKRLENEFAELE